MADRAPTSADVAARACSFTPAYALALGGCLASSALTFLYVGGPVREANPVTAAIIARIGLAGTFVVRTVALVAGFRVYAFVRRSTGWTTAPTAFAWVAAAVQVADALHDLRVALRVALLVGPPTGGLVACAALTGGGVAAGIVFRPTIKRTYPAGRGPR